jgi:hypothetical protein
VTPTPIPTETATSVPASAAPGQGETVVPAGAVDSGSGPGEQTLFDSVLSVVNEQLQSTVKPAAVAAVARTFTFPLALAVVVIVFLLVQARLDSRDPKLRLAPSSAGEAYVAFEEEDR